MGDGDILEHRDGPAAYLTLNRPQVRNAIDIAVAVSLRDACRRLEREARVIVLQGAGADFSVGGDARELARLRARGRAGVDELLNAFRSACETITGLRIPVVASVRGYALAGGFELVQCCDVALLSEDAVLGDHHVNMGVIPAGGGSQRLPRISGRPCALAHLLTGEHLTARDAVAWGLAYRSFPDRELDAAVRELAGGLCEKDPEVLAQIKALVNDGLECPLNDALDRELSAASERLVEDVGLLAEFGGAR